jgi:hypothetical protein
MADAWRAIVADALDWEQAHVGFERAVADLPAELRGRRPPGYPHSPWELVEHIRLAQVDLFEFMEDAGYAAPPWPSGYWPASPAPSTATAWDVSIAAVRRDRERLRAIATRPSLDLTAAIPWGEGRTYLRTVLVATDHTAYHVGQLVAVRRLLGAWLES